MGDPLARPTVRIKYICVDGNLKFNSQATENIHKFFLPLYINYSTYKENAENVDDDNSGMFKPSINKNSTLLSARVRPQSSLVNNKIYCSGDETLRYFASKRGRLSAEEAK